jgi:hypothetical protein
MSTKMHPSVNRVLALCRRYALSLAKPYRRLQPHALWWGLARLKADIERCLNRQRRVLVQINAMPAVVVHGPPANGVGLQLKRGSMDRNRGTIVRTAHNCWQAISLNPQHGVPHVAQKMTIRQDKYRWNNQHRPVRCWRRKHRQHRGPISVAQNPALTPAHP